LSVPLIDVVARPVDVVQRIVETLLRFAREETFPVRPGTVLAGRVQHALLRNSKLTAEAACKNPHRLVAPTDSGLTGTDLVAAYLGATAFSPLLTISVPFDIPRKTWASHGVALGPSGHGKTQLLQCIIEGLLQDPQQSFFFIDPHGDAANILAQRVHSSRLVF